MAVLLLSNIHLNNIYDILFFLSCACQLSWPTDSVQVLRRSILVMPLSLSLSVCLQHVDEIRYWTPSQIANNKDEIIRQIMKSKTIQDKPAGTSLAGASRKEPAQTLLAIAKCQVRPIEF